jgi:hypothetical protein
LTENEDVSFGQAFNEQTTNRNIDKTTKGANANANPSK